MFNVPFDWMTLSFGVSALTNFLIIVWFARIKTQSLKRNDTSAVQASHLNPTVRLGGLALVYALIVAAALSYSEDNWTTFVLLLVSAMPVFVIGLAEDLGYLASPRRRLLAATVSGAMFIALMGQWVLHTGMPGLDSALHWSPFAVTFSLFLGVGISHAFNLIDGLNGLAGFTALAAALALATIADQSGLTEHRDILLTIAAGCYRLFDFQLSIWQNLFGGCWSLRNWSPAVLDVCIHFVECSRCKSVCPAADFLLANSGHIARNHAALVSWKTHRTT